MFLRVFSKSLSPNSANAEHATAGSFLASEKSCHLLRYDIAKRRLAERARIYSVGVRTKCSDPARVTKAEGRPPYTKETKKGRRLLNRRERRRLMELKTLSAVGIC
jgi:hypothetical protein